VRPLPWWLLYELVTVAHAEWQELSAADRDRLTKIVVKSRGIPTNLTARERADVKRILAKVDLKRLARQMVPKAVSRRARLRP
jgi:hypothetical protein